MTRNAPAVAPTGSIRLLLCLLGVTMPGLLGASPAQVEAFPPLPPCLEINLAADRIQILAPAGQGSRELAHRHVGALPTSPSGRPALLLTGHPDQAVVLGAWPERPPFTVAFWVRRDAAPAIHPDGASHPEYLQEQALGQGRLLSPLTGHPRAAARWSGILRIGPQGLEVWHGPARWSVVIPGPLPAGEWMHLAVVFGSSGTATGYRAGRPAGSTPSDFAFGPGPLGLAAAALDRGYGFPFAGALADVCLVPEALSPASLARLAARPAPLATPPP